MAALAIPGAMHPARPSRSTELKIRSRHANPSPDARVLQLCLKQRHVHIGRAFHRARLAREAIPQRRRPAPRLQRVWPVQAAHFQHRANEVRPAARGHDFIARCDKRGHMVGADFRHTPQPLHCSRLARKDSSLRGERQHRLKRRAAGPPLGPRRSWSIRNQTVPSRRLAGIEEIMRIEGALTSRIRASTSGPSCSWQVNSVRAIPTPCSAASEPLNCCTNAETSIGDVPEFAHVVTQVQVQHRPDVQQSRTPRGRNNDASRPVGS